MRRSLVLSMLFLVASAFVGVTAYAAPAGSGSVDVRNLITVSQYSATGLGKLSPAQLQAFNAWLGQFLNSPAAASAASANAPDVRNYMSVNAYNQSGLANLSASELGALNAWFGQYLKANPQSGQVSGAAPAQPAQAVVAAPVVAAPAPQAAVAASDSGSSGFGMDSMAPEQNTETPKRIESRIVGEFNGWNGNTVFKLENGQVWQQAATGFYTNVSMENPQVVIKKLLFGYLLTLPGQGETVFVRRIK